MQAPKENRQKTTDAGVPQAVAQALIGHDSAAVHERYVSVGREALVNAADAFQNIPLALGVPFDSVSSQVQAAV